MHSTKYTIFIFLKTRKEASDPTTIDEEGPQLQGYYKGPLQNIYKEQYSCCIFQNGPCSGLSFETDIRSLSCNLPSKWVLNLI